jgi:beta-xylosidase
MVIGGKAEDFPDPFVLRIDDAAQCGTDPAPCYYAYSTEAGFLGLLNVPVARSTDLTTWNWAGGTAVVPTPPATPPPPTKDAMPVLASWVQFGGNWAPSVVARPSNPADQRYVMYYTGRSQTSSPFGGKECVGVATSAKPDGPFVDTASAPLLCQPSLGGTIDPSPFVASDGSLYLDYSNDTGIYARPLNFIGLTFSGGESRLLGLSDGFSWDKVHIEGPSMMSTPATGTLLFYSAGDFGFATYSVGAARCNGPLGPCGRVYSTAVLSSRGSMLGTGGQTPFQLANGSWRVGFHAWDGTVGYPAGGKRSLHFLPLTFPSNNPKMG